MWAGRSGLAAVGETAVRWRLGPRAPFARLGWEQGYYFDVSVAAAIGWPGDGNWSGDRPTIMPMDLRMALQTMDMDSSGWADVEELTVQTVHTFLRPDSGAGTGRWHWSGIISVDDGHGAVAAALATDPPASIGIWIDAGNVNWRDDSTGAWHTTTPGHRGGGRERLLRQTHRGGFRNLLTRGTGPPLRLNNETELGDSFMTNRNAPTPKRDTDARGNGYDPSQDVLLRTDFGVGYVRRDILERADAERREYRGRMGLQPRGRQTGERSPETGASPVAGPASGSPAVITAAPSSARRRGCAQRGPARQFRPQQAFQPQRDHSQPGAEPRQAWR